MIIRKPTAKDLPFLSLLWQETFGDSAETVQHFYKTAFSFDRCLVAQEQKPVGGIYWIDAHISGRRLAYLYAFAVAEHCRGKGIGKALLKKTLQTLRQEGYAGAILAPGEPSLERYYERAGFRTFEASWQAEPGSPSGASAERLSPQVYFALRQAADPAVGWAEEAFAYLAGFCRFYRAEDSLLTVSKEGVQEFLGDVRSLPGLLGDLAIGPFSEKRPRAMALCFEKIQLPERFGPIF